MHHNGCDIYHKFLVFDIQTSFIPACISQYYYNNCMFSDYQRYNVWLSISTFMSNCPVATTRVGLVLPMEDFSCPSQPLGPVQSKKVEHWGTGVQHKLLTVLSVFHKKCTSIFSVFVIAWGKNCCYLFGLQMHPL